MSPALRLMAAAALAVALAGCGGGGGSKPALIYREIDLASGTVTDRSSTWKPASAAATALVVRKIPATATTAEYWIGVYELTQAQWQALGGSAPTLPAGLDLDSASIGARRPQFGVDLVGLDGGFAAYSGGLGAAAATPHSLRVPTPGEWSHACLGSSAGPFPWGTRTDLATVRRYACVRETRRARGPAAVGSLGANAFNLYDVAGNVGEMVFDPLTMVDPEVRGGSWAENVVSASSLVSRAIRPDTPHALVGVRVVATFP